MGNLLSPDFFTKDVLEVAPALIGKYLHIGNEKFLITETEAYRGEEDLACHASKGRTRRTEVMYREGGCIYVYLIYGMYWMLNVVTEKKDIPQAVLIRGIEGFSGPGKLTRALGIDKRFNGKRLSVKTGLWIEDSGKKFKYEKAKRIGIEYAGEVWKNKLWRYVINES